MSRFLFKKFSILYWCVLGLIIYSTTAFAHAAAGSPHLKPVLSAEFVQKKEIRGTVSDSVGTLPGVSIRVKGTNLATTTDVNGRYILDVPDNESIIIFSMVGFITREIQVKGQNVINVVLKSNSNELDEVVVVAYGTQKKTDLIGAITTIEPKQLRTASSNLTTALAGRVGSIIGYQRSGEPGADNAAFFIRGVTTFGYKKDPLILIDGIELSVTELARLQVDDIANFSILKDATATSLYGSKGANGVILINTKQGRAGKTKISMRVENSTSSPTQNVALADPITYMRLHNEAILTRDPLGVLPYSDNKIDATMAGGNPYVYPTVDWRKELFKEQTNNQRSNLNVTGGGEAVQYYLSGTFNKDNGVLKVDQNSNFNNNIDLKSYSLLSNVNINATKSTVIGVKLYGTFDDYSGPIDGGSTLYSKVMRANPVLYPASYPADDAHRFVQHTLFGNSLNGTNLYINPYADMVRGYKEYAKALMLAQFTLKQNLSFLTDGLSIFAIGNTTRESFFDVARFYNPFYYQTNIYDKFSDVYTLSGINPDLGTEYLSYREGDKTVRSTLTLQAALNYNRVFAEKHSISGLLNFNMRTYLEGNAATLQKSLPSRTADLAGRTTYAYDNKYFAEFNFGYNGSERFYASRRFGFFPSVGAAWTVSNEGFMAPLKDVISNLKLRATYGLVGNAEIGSADDRFFYLSDVDFNNAARGAVFGTDYSYSRTGVLVRRYDNREITFEKSKKLNLGIELSLNSQFNIQADYFTEKRTNILQTRASLPSSLGLSAGVRANVGAASASGFDMSLDYSKSLSSNLSLTARGNFTYARSKFTIFEEPIYDEKNLSRIGYSLSQSWGYIAERLFVDEADVANSPVQNFGQYKAGDIKYKDVNGDGQVSTLDRVPIGFPTDPEIVYGFGVSATFKNFDLSCFLQGSARSSFFINNDGSTSPFISYRTPAEISAGSLTGLTLNNQLLKAYADSHWSEQNRDIYALHPRLSSTPIANNNVISTWFMRNGSFLRLKSVLLGYTLPQKTSKWLKLESVRFYAEGTNLATLSKFKLWDVEMGSSGLGYPIQKVVNFGLMVSF